MTTINAVQIYSEPTGTLKANEIPITVDSPYFSLRCEIVSAVYRFDFRWNIRLNRWIMDCYDQNDTAIFKGFAVVLGISYNRLKQSSLWPAELKDLVFVDTTETHSEPVYDTLGQSVKFIYTYYEQ